MEDIKKQYFYECLINKYNLTVPDAMLWLRMMKKVPYESLKHDWRKLLKDKETYKVFKAGFKEKEVVAKKK